MITKQEIQEIRSRLIKKLKLLGVLVSLTPTDDPVEQQEGALLSWSINNGDLSGKPPDDFGFYLDLGEQKIAVELYGDLYDYLTIQFPAPDVESDLRVPMWDFNLDLGYWLYDKYGKDDFSVPTVEFSIVTLLPIDEKGQIIEDNVTVEVYEQLRRVSCVYDGRIDDTDKGGKEELIHKLNWIIENLSIEKLAYPSRGSLYRYSPLRYYQLWVSDLYEREI